MSRPFGVALLFAGYDIKNGPILYHMDPSGTFTDCGAKAIGSGSEGAQQSLQEIYTSEMTLKQAIREALIILKHVMEEKPTDTNVEIATITPEKLYHKLSTAEIADIIKDL